MKILTVSEHWTSSGTPSWPLVFFSPALSTHKTFCRLFVCLSSPAKKTNYTKKSFTKNKNKNLYQRNRSCSSLPALTYLFISATATKELTRMCRARISRNHESASRRHSVQAKLERSKLRASTSLYPTKRVTDWPANNVVLEVGNKVSNVPYNFPRQLNEYLPTAKTRFCFVWFSFLFIFCVGGGAGLGFVGGEG